MARTVRVFRIRGWMKSHRVLDGPTVLGYEFFAGSVTNSVSLTSLE